MLRIWNKKENIDLLAKVQLGPQTLVLHKEKAEKYSRQWSAKTLVSILIYEKAPWFFGKKQSRKNEENK